MGKFNPSRTKATSQTVTGQWAANVDGGVGTFTNGDTTPSVATGNLWVSGGAATGGSAITMFDGGTAGQIITVIAAHAMAFDASATNLMCGTTDIACAAGDMTIWVFNGTNWYLIAQMDQDTNMNWDADD